MGKWNRSALAVAKSIVRFSNRKLEGYGLELLRRKRPYDEDGLASYHSHDFMEDDRFLQAYRRGIKACNEDYHFHWRVHVALWAAQYCLSLDGDFVECGVNRGVLSSSIMDFLRWNSTGRRFFLFDTFCGLDARYAHADELHTMPQYAECYGAANANFAEFQNVFLIQGPVPDTLSQAAIDTVCYLSIDMNCAIPEVAAAEFFWDRLSDGGLVLLDDYGYAGHRRQKDALDEFATARAVQILSLPTGQGLIIKPPTRGKNIAR